MEKRNNSPSCDPAVTFVAAAALLVREAMGGGGAALAMAAFAAYAFDATPTAADAVRGTAAGRSAAAPLPLPTAKIIIMK